jgi:hypothetical protein
MEAVVHFLDKEKWLELGVIIFSQYYDTAKWLADLLAARYGRSGRPCTQVRVGVACTSVATA